MAAQPTSIPAAKPWKKLRDLYRSGRLRMAVEGQVGNWIAAVGERLGSEKLMFNSFMFSGFHRGALETAPAATASLLSMYPELRTAVDLGCGTGVYMHELASRGVDVIGFEYSARARQVAAQLYGVKVLPFDLHDFAGPGRISDLCVCIEIAHYLPPALGDALVGHCARGAPLVMFSAAHPGQHGYGHINAQPRSYWIERFKRQGLRFNQAATQRLERELRSRLQRGFWLADNVCLFDRPGGA